MRKLAKRLVSPDLVCPNHWSGPDWVLTDGPAVAELNAAAGFAPDPQQELGLDMIFAVGENGLPASFAFCAICCRQNLKTGLLKQATIGWLYVTDEHRIVWSAHEMGTTRDAHKDLTTLIEDTPALSRRLPATPNRGIYDANGQERIELATGQVLKFKARTLSGGRGLTGDKVILDEAFALKPAHVGALLPTMTARPAGQVLYASSAGKLDSTVLRDVRDRGRAGSSPRLSYIEWLAPQEPCRDAEGEEDLTCQHPKDAPDRGIDCALDRQHLWRAANPTIATGRISIQTIADLRQELPPDEFARESLGWWEDPDNGGDSVFGPGRWPDCKVDPALVGEPPTDGLTIGVAVSIDQQWTSLGAGGRWGDSRIHVGPTEDAEGLADRRRGTLWVPARVKQLQDHYGCAVVIDEKCPDPNLAKALEDAGVKVHRANLEEVVTACAAIFNEVRDGLLTHFGTQELDDAVAGAVQRAIGDRWAWGRRKSESDVSMLEACTLAALGVREGIKPSKGFNIW